MTDTAQNAARIAFATYRNMNLGTARHFEKLGVSPEDFFELPARRLAAITGIRESFFDDGRRSEALAKGRAEATYAADNGIAVNYYTDDTYPHRMLECDDAPAMLFSLGAMREYRHVVAIVGTRHCTTYGAEFIRRLVKDLSESVDDLAVISGLAYGADIAAHRAAIANDVATGAVFAHGLNTIYPADHRDDARTIVRNGGFLVTEYPSYGAIHKGNFLARNRIVAAMADVTVVAESDIRGGAMSTARIAGAYNREVMALPGRTSDTYSRGCNALIAGGEASMIRDAADLIAAAGWSARKPEGTQKELPFLSPEQETIANFLKTNRDATVNDICAALSIPFSRLSSLLFEMEMEEVVSSLPGGRYCLLNVEA